MPFCRRSLAVALFVAALLTVAAPIPTEAAELGHLSGVVEDAKGKLLPGANLALVDAAGQTVATAVGNEDGRYDLAAPPGTYTLVADARSGGTPVHVTVPSVTVGAATPLDVVIVGHPGGLSQFRGRLVDASGAPISGAFVGLRGDAHTVTDADGRYELGVPPRVYNLTIVPRVEGFGSPHFHLGEFDLTRDRIGDLRLALVTHDVTVRHASGAPAEGAWVAIRPAAIDQAASAEDVLAGKADGDWNVSARTDAGGHVRLTGLATSDLAIDVNPPGRYSDSDRMTKTGIDGRNSRTLTVDLPTPPSLTYIRLSGTATDTDGVRPAETSFALSKPNGSGGYGSQRDHAAGDKAFTLDAPAGTYTLTWSPTSGPDEDWEGGDPTNDRYALSATQFQHDRPRHIDFRLPAAPGFPVRVLDPQGAPVAGALLTATSIAPAGSTDFELAPGIRGAGTLTSTRVTDADGVATVATLPGHQPSSVNVVPPTDRGLDGDFAIPAGATGLDVHLDRGVIVSGTLRQGNQPGRPDRHVSFVSESGRAYPVEAGWFDGTYRVSLPPGTYEVATDNDDNEPGGESDDHWNATSHSTAFTVTGDRTLDLTYPEPSGASVRFVGADSLSMEGEIELQSESARDFMLAPGITASASSWFSAFGARDSSGIQTWPGGAIASGRLDSSLAFEFSGIRLMPGGAAVVVLAQGYSLARPDPPAVVSAIPGAGGSATISWDSAGGHGNPILGYHVEVHGDDGQEFVVSAATTCVIVTGLSPHIRHRVYVSAMTIRGMGEGGSAGGLVTPDANAPNQSPSPACPPPGSPPLTPPSNEPGPPPDDGGFRPSITGPSGYWALSSDGKVYNFGSAPHLGNSVGGAVDLEPSPTGLGYWTLNRNGAVTPFGDATPLGNVDVAKLGAGEQPASLSTTPSGNGYWVFTTRGRALAFGDAAFLGDMSGTKLNGPVLGSVATPTGKGYYMVASDGGIFAFGDAKFLGSMGETKLNAPVQSLVPGSDGKGYWLVASDGGIFAFDAPFKGSAGGIKLNKPVVGMVRYGDGYLMVGADGGIFNFSSLPFSGSLGDKPPSSPVVAIGALP